ncbi:MAG: flagellar assembly protein H [Armatimonadetes bacterium]|nr:flagellar assembly protein H [Armatimonadota bacterium]
MDRDSLEFLDKELFTDVTAGERHEVDLVAKLRFREAGQESVFLVHVEHQAQAQEHFNRRLFTYYARLHGLHDLPIYPIALFSHLGRKLEAEEYRQDCRGLEVLRFRYRVIQLSRLQWRDFLGRQNPVACALMARMNIAQDERPRVKAQCLRLLLQLKLDPAKIGLIAGFVDSYLRLSETETLDFEAELAEFGEKEQHQIVEITTSWKEEGLEQGRREGLREALTTLLELRFGENAALKTRVATIEDVNRLRNLFRAAEQSQSLEEFQSHLG